MTVSSRQWARALDVYWDKRLVGQLMQNRAGSMSFAYDAGFLDAGLSGISISLPCQEDVFEGDVVQAFFSGLLPEESVRARLAQYLGISEQNAFGLLQEVGVECAGALALYPTGEGPASMASDAVETLDEVQLAEVLALIKRRPFLAGGELRLSLAGAQDKLAVGFENGHVLLIKGAQPTTHILKPVIERITDSAHNELFAMRLAKRVGLDVPFADIHFVNETPYYLVERFDRARQADGSVQRIHQEDFCQALGVLPELKYEREGGPGLASCQQLLFDHAAQPAFDQIKLLEMVIFNYLIGNCDAHGKNFSLLYRGEKPQLAPAYDLLSTAVYPDLSSKMAMKIGGKYEPKDVFARHWHRLVPATKMAQSAIHRQLKVMAERTIEHALTLKEELAAQGVKSPIFADILRVIEKRSQRLLNPEISQLA